MKTLGGAVAVAFLLAGAGVAFAELFALFAVSVATATKDHDQLTRVNVADVAEKCVEAIGRMGVINEDRRLLRGHP